MKVERIGKATLYLADCVEVLPTLDKVDAVVTDPPYGIGIAANPVRQKHEKAEWDNYPPSPSLIASIINCARESVVWGGNHFGLPATQCFLVWDKYQPQDFSLAMCEMAWTNLRKPAKLFRLSVHGYEKFHPTQKPEPLMKWCISLLENKTGVILDPFAGSGTTGVAAVQMQREFVGIEREPKYFDIACRRIEDAQRQGNLFAA